MASSSSSPHVPVVTHSEIRHKVQGMNVKNTKFFDPNVVHRILATQDICFFNNGNDWFKLLKLGTPAYTRLTKEFLSSLTIHFRDEMYLDDFYIEFTMGGIHAKVPIGELNEIYGIKRAENHIHYREFDPRVFWRTITMGNEYDQRTSNAHEIRNPTLRYMHFVIANTIFGRSKGTHRVLPSNLFALWSLTVGNQVNIVYFMCKHFEDFVVPYDNTIVVGGLITPIAEYHGIKLDDYEEAIGKRRLDMTSLVKLGMLSPQDNGAWLLQFSDRPPFQLPNFDHVRLDDQRNWKMDRDLPEETKEIQPPS